MSLVVAINVCVKFGVVDASCRIVLHNIDC